MKLFPESGISIDTLEKIVVAPFLKTACEVDMKQLAIGILVEMEHTKDPKEAEKIARVHLEENEEYYTKPMKKNWGADEAIDRIKELTKDASSSGLKDCQRCKGDGMLHQKLRNPGTGDYVDHIVPCDMPGCHDGKYDPSTLCQECHNPDGSERHLHEIGHKASAEKTWKQIEKEQDPDGKGHDLRLICTRCNNSQTCKCMKPKREFKGLCDRCASGLSAEDYENREDEHIKDILKEQGRLMPNASSVFVLENDPERIAIFKSAFGEQNVFVTRRVKEALDALRTRKFAKVFLDRDLGVPNETGEDVAWQMEREGLCRQTPVVIHSENTRGQKVMAKYLNKYHTNVTIVPFRQLRKSLDIPGGVKI